MNSVVRPLATIYTGSTHPESFLVSYRRMSLTCVQAPPPLTDVSLPIFSEGRGASVLRLVYSLPLACAAGVEKGRGREEGKKAGGGGGAGLRASSLWPDRAPQRACSQAKGVGSLGTELITGTYLLVGKMNSREEGFKKAFVEGLGYESATQSNWKTKEGGAINLSPCGSLGIV